MLLYSLLVVGIVLHGAHGHGYLSNPPNRASMWRYNYSTPVDYTDNEFFCGGFETQWNVYHGRCGECGDSYGDPRPRSNENTGLYGTGVTTRRYIAGQEFTASVEITANHYGWFQFNLCPLSSATDLETESCFDDHVLQLADGSGTKYNVTSPDTGTYPVKLRLPADLTCDKCVLRWHYTAGNSWGLCSNGTFGIGCGRQETFRSCSDIGISGGWKRPARYNPKFNRPILAP